MAPEALRLLPNPERPPKVPSARRARCCRCRSRGTPRRARGPPAPPAVIFRFSGAGSRIFRAPCAVVLTRRHSTLPGPRMVLVPSFSCFSCSRLSRLRRDLRCRKRTPGQRQALSRAASPTTAVAVTLRMHSRRRGPYELNSNMP